MANQKPLCAYCGKKLTGSKIQSQILFAFVVPGNPTIGWHWEICHSADEFARKPGGDDDAPSLPEMVREIMRRGPGRVVHGKAFLPWLEKRS